MRFLLIPFFTNEPYVRASHGIIALDVFLFHFHNRCGNRPQSWSICHDKGKIEATEHTKGDIYHMITHLPGPAYRITTSRLIVRCYQPADAALVKAAIDENIEHLRPWMPWISAEPQTIQQKIDLMRRFRGAFDQDVDYVYGIFDQQETRQLGSTGLHPRLGPGAREIGYWIHKDFTRQGLATETSAALTRVAFEIDGVSRVEIHCDDQNIASAAVPRKLGYTLETILSEPDPCNEGRLRQTMIWVLYRDHYPLTPSAQASLQAFDAGGRRIL